MCIIRWMEWECRYIQSNWYRGLHVHLLLCQQLSLERASVQIKPDKRQWAATKWDSSCRTHLEAS